MRVFVLGTGRCGTTTFVRACEHLDGFSAGHETRVRRIGDDRFDYPDGHIEADNRLAWFLGALGDRFDGTDVLYVHLRRRRDDVIASFLERWDAGHRTSIIRAFAHAVVMHPSEWAADRVEDVCAFYVDTVTANIAAFTAGRPSIEVHLESIVDAFPAFAGRIGATGGTDRAMAELEVRHNASGAAAARPPDILGP